MSRPFNAKYRGRCAGECGDPIQVGDEVVFVADELVHTECADPMPDVVVGGVVTEVCPHCFLVHAGECF